MKTIKLAGKELPILISVNVVEQIQKRYGNVTELAKKIRDFGEIKWVLTQAINAAAEYQAYLNGTPATHLSDEEVGAIMEIKDFQAAVDVMIEALEESLGAPKNSIAGEVSRIAASLMEEKTSL